MKILILLFVTIFSLQCESAYRSIDEISTMKIKLVSEVLVPDNLEGKSKINGDGIIIQVTRELIAFGQYLYSIVKDSKPIITINSPAISILPIIGPNQMTPTFAQMEQWKGAKIQTYQFVFENMVGIEVVSFKYKLHLYYGGKYNHTGQYIKGLVVIPDYIEVEPGYDLAVDYKLLDVVNMGTSQSPIPSASILLNLMVDGPIDLKSFSATFQVKGNGEITVL
ncbi:MAG: hypothetical protein QE271_04670 [Bacteriovoracaceae bacterium]|nr:hypothetical protein [Bacteriovoracaceae bacterium]